MPALRMMSVSSFRFSSACWLSGLACTQEDAQEIRQLPRALHGGVLLAGVPLCGALRARPPLSDPKGAHGAPRAVRGFAHLDRALHVLKRLVVALLPHQAHAEVHVALRYWFAGLVLQRCLERLPRGCERAPNMRHAALAPFGSVHGTGRAGTHLQRILALTSPIVGDGLVGVCGIGVAERVRSVRHLRGHDSGGVLASRSGRAGEGETSGGGEAPSRSRRATRTPAHAEARACVREWAFRVGLQSAATTAVKSHNACF